MNVGVVPQHGDALLDGELFEFDGTYDPLQPYGADRAGFHALKKHFEANSTNVVTIDRADISTLDAVIFVDTDFDWLDRLLDADATPRLIYLMREPPTFIGDNDPQKFTDLEPLFDLVFTWNDDLVERGKRYVKYRIPQFPERHWGDRDFDERSLLVNVTARKYSNYPGELYTARERVIGYFDVHHPGRFTLFGKGWNKPPTLKDITLYRKLFPTTYQTYEGIVDDKITAYHDFRFALCFENTTGINGYVTEKIFDCFRAGVVPVYWGASNITEYIPKDLFVDYRQFDGPEDLYDHLDNVTEAEFDDYLDRIASFLDNGFSMFSPETYAKTIHDGLQRLPHLEPKVVDSETKAMVRNRAKAERIINGRDTLPRRTRIRKLALAIVERPRVAIDHPRALYYAVR